MGFTLGPTVFLRNLIRGPHYNTAATLEVVATAALFTTDVSADQILHQAPTPTSANRAAAMGSGGQRPVMAISDKPIFLRMQNSAGATLVSLGSNQNLAALCINDGKEMWFQRVAALSAKHR